eukprot:scaffold449_cov184-Amphora_coffeaeformis.AAC.17
MNPKTVREVRTSRRRLLGCCCKCCCCRDMRVKVGRKRDDIVQTVWRQLLDQSLPLDLDQMRLVFGIAR